MQRFLKIFILLIYNKTNANNMRRILTALFICLSFALQAQQSTSRGTIGITYSGLGDNDSFYWESLDGAGDAAGKGFYSFGITYLRPISSRLDLETGVEFSHSKYKVSSASLGPTGPEPYNVSNNLIGIPLTVRFNFLRHLFINGGLLLDFDADNKSTVVTQSGIGAMLGVGAKYNFKSVPIGVFLNPYFKHHRILSFSMDNHPLRSYDAGFRFGVVYHL